MRIEHSLHRTLNATKSYERLEMLCSECLPRRPAKTRRSIAASVYLHYKMLAPSQQIDPTTLRDTYDHQKRCIHEGQLGRQPLNFVTISLPRYTKPFDYHYSIHDSRFTTHDIRLHDLRFTIYDTLIIPFSFQLYLRTLLREPCTGDS
jgi:hypothetical protein